MSIDSAPRDFPASRQPVGHLVAREALAYAGAALLFPFGLAQPRGRTPRRREQRTVVLIHGYLANHSSLWALCAYLRIRRVGRVLCFDYRSAEGIERSARALARWLRAQVRGGRIDLVGHSLGGLVARVYLQHLGGARRVDRCITLGTPHRGTYNAYWMPSAVGRDLRPDSALLDRLAATRDAAARVRFTSIVAGSDPLVVPRLFAADDDVVQLPDLGHIGLLFSPRAFHTIADRLLRPASATAGS